MNILRITLGNLSIALSVTVFVIPGGMIMGGSTGIGLILAHFFDLPLALCVWIINIALFLLGLAFLGRAFAAKTLACTVLYPFFLQLFEASRTLQTLHSDPVLCALFGGILLGIGEGLILRAGASSGGTDIPALILHRYTHADTAHLLYMLDFLILLGQAVFSGFSQILYGVLFLIIQTAVVNRTQMLGRTQIQLVVISDQYARIRRRLLNEEDVGVTMLLLEKGFTGHPTMGILCVIPRRKLYEISRMIGETDPDAFLTVQEVNEVRGHGFTSERVKLPLGEERTS